MAESPPKIGKSVSNAKHNTIQSFSRAFFEFHRILRAISNETAKEKKYPVVREFDEDEMKKSRNMSGEVYFCEKWKNRRNRSVIYENIKKERGKNRKTGAGEKKKSKRKEALIKILNLLGGLFTKLRRTARR